MFTGIIEDIGSLLTSSERSAGLLFRIATNLPHDEIALGDSIAVCGVCLTVTHKQAGWFEAELSHETLHTTKLKYLRVSDQLHLERALMLSGRLDGHLVSGHVDGVGKLTARNRQGANLDLQFWAPEEVRPFLVNKGSIAIDGVSLTVNRPTNNHFWVTLVPHTLDKTLFGQHKIGAFVNLEADMIGKYVKHFVDGKATSSKISEAFLKEHGFK